MAFTVITTPASYTPHPCGIVRARWSEADLDECFRSILEQRPELKAAQLARTRELMQHAIPNSTVTGYEHLIEGLTLPDPDDRHVLAAAIRAGAQSIVTFNLEDFPAPALASYAVEALHPDEFVLDMVDLAAAAVANVIRDQAASLRNPPQTVSELLDTLRNAGLVQTVARLRWLYGEGVGSDE